MEPPVLLLNYQENQETWTRAWGDLAAAAHLFPSATAVVWLQKTAKTAMARGAGFIAVAASPRSPLFTWKADGYGYANFAGAA